MFNIKLYYEKLLTIRLKKIYFWGLKCVHAESKSVFSMPVLLIKMAKYFKNYGCSPYEYINYNLFKMNKNQLESCYLNLHNVEFLNNINDLTQIHILRDKRILLQRLENRVGREFLDLENSTEHEFQLFLQKHPKIIVKPTCLAAGTGIEVYDLIESPIDFAMLRKELLEKNLTLVEEFIKQHKVVNRIYEKSVNTIRIHTLKTKDQIEIVLNLEMRFGSGEAKTDFDNGITVHIDSETGNLSGCGFHKNHVYAQHPDSNIIFDGYKIPFIEEAKKLVIYVASLVPELNFIGWDVAISEQGPVIVEGNGASAAYSFHQFKSINESGYGVKKQYDELLSYYRKRMHLDDSKINKINEILYIESNFNEDYNIIILLGSKSCYYRAEKALSLLKNNDNTLVIVSGGNSFIDDTFSTEADFMYDFLKRNGIKETRIFIERESKNTVENLTNSIKYIEKHCGKERVNVGIVTGGFHMKRVFNLLKQIKTDSKIIFHPIPAYGKNTNKTNWFKNQQGLNIISKELEKLGYSFFKM